MSFSYVVFTDLHVEARTLDRAIDVLQRVRELATRTRSKVVCLGDFWERRGTLQVRQLHAVQREFEQWRDQGVDLTLIPGNHDQVTANGEVHGVDVFSAFPNIHVATDPIIRFEERTVFLPWREDPTEQSELFWALAGDEKWTVFAHAEVQGARTNHAHVAPGRVTLHDIEGCARACYVGHYHKRQQLGDRTWYIGSPFEMNFGERDMPHGVAVVTSQAIEPHFIDFDHMPRHLRIALSEIPTRAQEVREHDVVEVLWPAETLQGDLEAALALLPAQDVRPRPVGRETAASTAAALTLDDALPLYVKGADITPDMSEDQLIALGRSLLRDVPQAKAHAPIGKSIQFQHVTLQDFCGARGSLTLPLESQGLLLLRGDQGVGKTSLVDAITWCLYGATTPRKAGGDAPSLTGDDVIHDEAASTTVSVGLTVDGAPLLVERSKKRGKGARVKIVGAADADGLSDQQERIERVIGLDFTLWRACVSLGQGAVGNFLTAADKRRKEILSAAYDLDACEPASKSAKERLARVLTRIDSTKHAIATREGGLAEIRAQDFAEAVKRWEHEQAAEREALDKEHAHHSDVVVQCNLRLADEPKWRASEEQHLAHRALLSDQLAKFPIGERVAQLQQQIASYHADKSALVRSGAEQRGHLQRAMQARQDGSGVVCPACKRPFEASAGEEHVEVLEKSIVSIDDQVRSYDIRLSDATQALGALALEHDAARQGVRAQLDDVQKALTQIAQALATFAQIRANLVNAEQQVARIAAQRLRMESAPNPWVAKQQEQLGRMVEYERELKRLREERSDLDSQETSLAFWVRAFSAKGLPVLVLRAVIAELETHVNRFLGELTQGAIYAVLEMDEDDLRVGFRQFDPFTKQIRARRYEQLSGGERRCAELAFSPFGIGELIFARTGARVKLLLIDELTTHLGALQKSLAVRLLYSMGRDTVVVVDHDLSVQGEFDRVVELSSTEAGVKLENVK